MTDASLSVFGLPVTGIIQEKPVKIPLICALALGVAAIGGAASAQDSVNVSTVSEVSARCAALTPGATLDLGELADVDGFAKNDFDGPDTTAIVAGYWCNAPAEVTLAASPLLNQDTATALDPGFTTRIDYLASLAWDDFSASNETATGAPTVEPTAEANIGDIVVTVSDPVAAGRLVAGAYEGSVTITISLL